MIVGIVSGLPDLREALRGIAPKLRARAVRNALAAGARVVRAGARAAAPVLDLGNPSSRAASKAGRRRPGTVRNALAVRTSKSARRAGNVGVFVNVRPARGAARGANNPRDPFYWRWLNFGWNPARKSHGAGTAGARLRRRLNREGAAKAVPGAHFLEAGAARLSQALGVIMAALPKAIAKLNRPKAPPP